MIEKKLIVPINERYSISSDGEIYDKKRQVFKKYKTKFAKITPNLVINIPKTVALKFIPIPEELSHLSLRQLNVFYIDGDKSNHSADNLMWISQSDYMRHVRDNEYCKFNSGVTKENRRPVSVTNSEGVVIGVFDSIAEAARNMMFYPEFQNISFKSLKSYISLSIKKDRTVHGYKFIKE